ncbi:MAG: Formate/nitrite transporter-domain-containing protein [Monoraphidium minutum]|nr:MAG: Formate/nitrite transporter-domain-containing protein [Monoraphidium minutum]
MGCLGGAFAPQKSNGHQGVLTIEAYDRSHGGSSVGGGADAAPRRASFSLRASADGGGAAGAPPAAGKDAAAPHPFCGLESPRPADAPPAAPLAVRARGMVLTPPEIYEECVRHGEDKARMGWLKLLVLTVLAGCYIGFGFSLCLVVGGNIGLDILKERPGLFSLALGAIGFPTGFTFIVICGGELFTSLCAYMAAAWWEGRATARDCLRLWAVSWIGNFVGTALFVGLMLAAGTFEGKSAFALLLATKKAHHGFGHCFVLGILCNWLVCIATWQANAAQDMAGKFIAIWLPISAFVMLGCEHIVADMFLLPLSLALGNADLTAADVIVGNLIPTTLGNWVGGALCVATSYAFVYGTPNRSATKWAAAAARRLRRPAAGAGGACAGAFKLPM